MVDLKYKLTVPVAGTTVLWSSLKAQGIKEEFSSLVLPEGPFWPGS